jgi:hypothetical protein
VLVIRLTRSTDCRPPLVSANRRRIGVPNTVTDVVVIADRIERFALGVVDTPRQQLWIEDLLLDVSVHIQLVGKRTPNLPSASFLTDVRACRLSSRANCSRNHSWSASINIVMSGISIPIVR